MRIEPPVSVPNAPSAIPAATAAAHPPLEPPAVSDGRSGFATSPPSELRERTSKANSDIFALARIIAPALRNRCITSASDVALSEASARQPRVMGIGAQAI